MAEQYESGWQQVIRAAVRREVSDIHLTGGQYPYFRVDGRLSPFSEIPLPAEFLSDQLQVLLTAYQWQHLQADRTLDFSCSMIGRRFRGNAYYQQGRLALALRLLPEKIPTMEELGCPQALYSLLDADHGLILVCGQTGAGKTTTLAAFLDTINHRRPAHIITLEDPIEYIFRPDRCFISQRELGADFDSFPQALRSALRETPDIVLVGEIRDRETLQTALMAAAAGMQVLGTLHTRNVCDAVMRIEGLFPTNQQGMIRAQIAEVLSGIFAQRLLPCKQGGRICMTEVLLAEPSVRNLIRQGKAAQLESIMMSHKKAGMQTQSLAVECLYEKGRITRETREKYGTSSVPGGCG